MLPCRADIIPVLRCSSVCLRDSVCQKLYQHKDTVGGKSRRALDGETGGNTHSDIDGKYSCDKHAEAWGLGPGEPRLGTGGEAFLSERPVLSSEGRVSPRQRKEKSFPGKETVPCKVGGGSTGEGGRRGPWTGLR